MIKHFTIALGLTLTTGISHAQNSLSRLWVSDTSLQTPESVLFDPVDKCLWVSCINGQPLEKDGNGSIWQLRPDGRIIDKAWVTGLHAPKGMARFGKTLYVSDISELIVIDIYNRKITKRIPIEGATFLNDVTATEDGTVYVSDMNTGKIHRLKDDKTDVYLSDLRSPNGVLAVGDALFFLAAGNLYKHQAGITTKLAEGMDASTDGIEMIKPGEFVVSCWTGVVYHVTETGKVTQMLDTRKKNINSADIGFDRSTKTVFVPTFFKNNITAYQLK